MRRALASGGVLRALGASDGPAIQALAERCLDYMMMSDGEPAAPDTGEAFLRTGPPGHPIDKTFRLGVEQEGRLVGLVEMPVAYPSTGDWFIALLLLDPDVRGRGVGRDVVRTIEGEAIAAGATRIELSVLDANEPASRFWRSLGFVETGRIPSTRFARLWHERTVFEKWLGNGAGS